MKRGDIVTVAMSGDYGKPRPAVLVQSDFLADGESVLVCLLTTTLRDAPFYRIGLEANAANGLRADSQLMLDKMMAVRRDKCGPVLGRVDDTVLRALAPMLTLMLGLAE